MKLRASCLVLVLSALLPNAWAQSPRVGYVYPAGGQCGTSFLVEVGGQGLRAVDGVHVTGDGVRAEVSDHAWALSNDQQRAAQSLLREVVKRRWMASAMDAASAQTDPRYLPPDHPLLRDLDAKSPAELEKLWTRLFSTKKQPNAQIAESVLVEVTIAPDAAPGDRELRLISRTGLSNPLCFKVGALLEACEENAAGDAAPVLVPPLVLNGQVLPGEVDRFAIRARAGQPIAVRVEARALMPYLADAVPGWFQATLALYDPGGREVAFCDDYHLQPDPVLLYQAPADGVYTLEISDAIFRGREDFVYRITVEDAPSLPASPIAGGAEGDAALPEGAESEPNDRPDEPQQIALPVVIAGRIGRVGDLDTFSFDGRAGEEIVAEVYARRLASPLDSGLSLLDDTGTEVAGNDDTPDPAEGLMTHHADSYLRVQLPRDGRYRIVLRDMQHGGGDDHAYRLRVAAPQPDFVLRVTPPSATVAPGRPAKLKLHAIRRDGFAGEIEVALIGAPASLRMAPATIPAGADTAEATLTVAGGGERQVVPVQLEGRAQIDGAEVVRPVVPAEEMMQAFAYWQVVPRQELLVAINRAAGDVPVVWRPEVEDVSLAGPQRIRLPLGESVEVHLAAEQAEALERAILRVANRPRGVILRDVTPTAAGLTVTLSADPYIATPGETASAMIEVFAEAPDGFSAAGAQRSRVSLGVLPVIELEITRN